MATYLTLRNRALKRVGCYGQGDAEDVAEQALEEAMRYVAHNVRVPSLIASATATAPADPELEASAITLGVGGFNITSTYQYPDRLNVKSSSTSVDAGVPYEYREYHQFLDQKNTPLTNRVSLDSRDNVADMNPQRVFTITPSSKLWAMPLSQNNVLTLFYHKTPAVYADGTTPEILAEFDYILVNGAELALKEWLREPDQVTSLWTLFESGLKTDVEEYNRRITAARKRYSFKPHNSYRP